MLKSSLEVDPVPRVSDPGANTARLLLLLAALGGALAAAPARALPPGFVDDLVTAGLSAPTALAFLPDGRLLVAEQGGTVRIVVDDVLETTPLVSLRVDSQGERGVIGLAVHPNFAANGFVYVHHTVPASADLVVAAHNQITRFVVQGNEVDPASARTILVLDDLSTRTNHNGGGMAFGSDGKLYVTVGDARTGANAQSLANRFGKVLRLDDDGAIPSGNPEAFSGIAGAPEGDNRAIWAVGLRNPFRIAVHPHTGRIFVHDVGENRFEEINEGRAGANYGWPSSEGPTTLPDIDPPLYHYGHSTGTPVGCAITGGAFYDVGAGGFPAEYNDKYYFVDYCGDWIYAVDPASPDAATPFHDGMNAPVDLAVGPDGALYYVQAGNGQVRRIRYDGNSAQRIRVSANQIEVGEGQAAEIAIRLGNPPLDTSSVSAKLVFADKTITMSPSALTFDASNWDTPQNINVSVADDRDGRDEGGKINLAMADAQPVSVWVNTIDDDKAAGAPRAIISRPRPGEVVRGATAEFFGDGRDDGRVVRAEFYVGNVLRFVDVNDSGHFHIGGDHNMWNTLLLPNGYYQVRLRVFDETGASASHEVKIRILN